MLTDDQLEELLNGSASSMPGVPADPTAGLPAAPAPLNPIVAKYLASKAPRAAAPSSDDDDDADFASAPIPPGALSDSPSPAIGSSDTLSSSQAAPSAAGSGGSLNPIVARYLASRQEMAGAQAAANQNTFYANLARAGGTLSHALSKSTQPMDQSGFNALDKSANQPVEAVQAEQSAGAKDLEAQAAVQNMGLKGLQTEQAALALKKDQAAQDPNSPQSQAFRKSVEKLAPGIASQYGDLWAQVTAADQDKILKPIELREQINARKETASLNRQLKASQIQAVNEKQTDKMAQALKDDLDPNKARGGNLAKNQSRIDNASRIQALLNQVHNNPDPRQMEELAISAQALLSATGTPGAEQVKALIPHTAWGNIQAFKEWLTNNPTGTEQQAFVQRMAETVEREKDVASQQVQTAQRQRLAAHARLKNSNPELYTSIVNSYGLGDQEKPIQLGQNAPIPAAGKVRVSNGQKTYLIDPSDLASAQASGFRQVQ